MKKTVEILWTGGYDSTFRICQLSRKNVIIQPYYLSDKRKSEKNELHAINVITQKLKDNKDTKAIIKKISIVSKDDRKNSKRISSAFKRLLNHDFMGSQYEWLGVFAIEHKGIELSIHKDDKAIELIKKHGKIKVENDDSIGEYYVIDPLKSSDDLVSVFGNMHFPLVDYTKLQMKKEYELLGLEDIIDDTWFCHSPIKGKPCGWCNPCKYTIQEGMAYRFDKSALIRYKLKSNALYKCVEKAKKSIKKIV